MQVQKGRGSIVFVDDRIGSIENEQKEKEKKEEDAKSVMRLILVDK